MQVTETPIAELVAHDGNAKLHPDWQVAQIAESIRAFGFADPVGIWHDERGRAVIVEGHGRVMAAKSLGMETVPTISLDHMTDEERRAYGIAHNSTNMGTGFDADALPAEVAGIETIDMAAFGIDPVEALEALPEVDEEPVPTPEDLEGAEPRVAAGDVWRMGDHVLLCGDATHHEDVMRLIGAGGGSLADLLLTDPPYDVALGYGMTPEEARARRRRTDGLTVSNDGFQHAGDFRAFIADALEASTAAMRDGAAFYVWFAAWRTKQIFEAFEDAGLEIRQELYWIKQVFTLSRQDYQWQTEPCVYGWKGGAAHWFAPTRTERNVLDGSIDTSRMTKEQLRNVLDGILAMFETDAIREDRPTRSLQHPTMKPVALFARLIRNSSRPGDVVLDPFAGSGTTVIACERMGRAARVMELDPRYADVILRRWEDETGREAVRIG